MTNENPNNPHWKNKLEDAENLSGEILQDKAATWKKLHNRLREKPQRTRVVWVWAVAACLLLAMFLPFIREYNNKNNLTKHIVHKGAVPNPSLKEMQPVKEEAVTAITIVPAVKEKSIKNKTVNENNTMIDTDKKLAAINTYPAADSEIISFVPVTDSFYTTTIATAQPKKKLKLVHINELGDPIEEAPDMAHTAEQHAFYLKLANQEVFVNPSVAYNKSRFTIFKTKSSTN